MSVSRFLLVANRYDHLQHELHWQDAYNLDHRIEVVAPVEERRLKDEIQSVFDVLMADNVQAWPSLLFWPHPDSAQQGNGRGAEHRAAQTATKSNVAFRYIHVFPSFQLGKPIIGFFKRHMQA